MNKIKSMMTASTLAVATLGLTGCATIMGSPAQSLPIYSNPQGADYKITDEKGYVIQEGKTPAVAVLPKHDGSYFGKKTYSISFTKEGYKPLIYPLKTDVNGKYILGNLIFGSVIGWFILDPLNGGMYDISPTTVETNLEQQ